MAHDPVNSPQHYTNGGIETIDFIRSKMSLSEFVAYCRGNALKYASRAGLKGDSAEDLKKGAWYLNRAAEEIAKSPTKRMPYTSRLWAGWV